MTIEEKLKKCLEFIERLEKMNIDRRDMFNEDDIHIDCECRECGSDDIRTNVVFDNEGRDYVDISVLEDIKDAAWHLKADISD